MKIVFFIGALSKGGAERQLIYVANGLAEQGHTVTILTMRGGSAYEDLLESSVNIESLDVGGVVDTFSKTSTYLVKNRPDRLICFLYYATLVGRILGTILRLDVITSYRNISYGSRLRDLVMKSTSFLDKITLSNVLRSREKMLPKCRWKKMVVIPNIYSPGDVKRGEVNLPERSGFRWCYIGRLERQKNLEQLILAFSGLINNSQSDFQLLLLGEGRQRDFLEKMVAELGLENKVFFLGHSFFVHSVLEACDAFILPSRWEGMPNVLMEAMAAKLPAVATPVGAVPEMISDGETGFISRGFDANSLEAAMQRLFSLETCQRKNVGERAGDYIEMNCSKSAVMDMWQNVLKADNR